MTTILERARIALECGEWWYIPWWKNEKYYGSGFASKKKAENAFRELIRTFDAKWMLGQRTNGNPFFSHQMAIRLMEEGESPFQFLCELGDNLHTARRAGLLGDIERRLKNSKEYWEAAVFELNLLARLLRNRYKVERNHSSGKGRHNCDFKVSKKSETVFLEIKRPKELIARNLQIVNEAQSRFVHKLLQEDRNNSAREEDFASPPLSSRVEANKVFRIIRDAANYQIPISGPGIVIVNSPDSLNWNEIETIAEKRFSGRKPYANLSAVILTKTLFHESKIQHESRIIINERASVDMKSSAILELFRT
jgi:hypothetical protein